jgi:DedD protein
MNGSYSSDNDLHDLDEAAGRDQEISLGTSTVLGIFFALALVCALFFGFGYAMGRRAGQATVSPAEASPVAASEGAKPLPGSPAGSQSAKSGDGESGAQNQVPVTRESADVPSVPAAGSSTVVTDLQPSASSSPAETKAPAKAAVSGVTVGPSIAGSFFVQIAAVSHREDADILISTLTKRGYDVVIHQEPQDKLMHVQIGPFSNKKDADAMKQRLLADGYNAIVK